MKFNMNINFIFLIILINSAATLSYIMPDYKKGSKNLFTNLIGNLYDDDWKRVRNQVTPVFTTGKLKKVPIIFYYLTVK